jgi:hypothetical protein
LLYTPCWPSKLFACVQKHHTSGKSVCGKLLIRSILVLLFSFEVPWKNNQKNIQQKKNKKEAKKQEGSIEGALCMFSFLLCGGAF